MEGILQTFLKPIYAAKIKPKSKSAMAKNDDVIGEINTVKEQLRNVQNRFDLYTDFDLTESCIYEMEALEARYRYLIKKAKNQNVNHIQFETLIQN